MVKRKKEKLVEDLFIDDEYFAEEEREDEIKTRRKYLLLIVILFLFFSLLFGMGIYYIKAKNSNKINNAHEDLFVIHSKKEFGDTVESFTSHNSKETAFTYTFYVENESKADIFYTITSNQIKDNTLGTMINQNNVFYALYKDGNLLFEGKFAGTGAEKLAQQKILASSREDYELKLWSNSSTGYYKFRIDVENK